MMTDTINITVESIMLSRTSTRNAISAYGIVIGLVDAEFTLSSGAALAQNIITSGKLGKGDFIGAGRALHRNILGLMVYTTVYLLFASFSHSIFLELTQNQGLTNEIFKFLFLGTVNYSLSGLTNAFKNFEYAFHEFDASVWISACKVVLELTLASIVLLIYRQGLPVLGLVMVTTSSLEVLAHIIYCATHHEIRRSFIRPTLESFHGMWRDFKMYLTMSIIGSSEWLAGDLTTFLGASLPMVQMTSHSLAASIVYSFWGFPVSIGITMSSYIAFLIGARRKELIPTFLYGGVAVSFMIGLASFVIILLVALFGTHLITADLEVQRYLKHILIIGASYKILEMKVGTLGFSLRALGKQNEVLAVSLGGVLLIGFPLQIAMLRYTNLGVYGLWIGYGCNLVFVVICYTVLFQKALDSIKRGEEIPSPGLSPKRMRSPGLSPKAQRAFFTESIQNKSI